MMKRISLSLLAALSVLVLSGQAHAMAINRCTRIVQNNVGRESVVNICKQCVKVSLERRRPGKNPGVPSMREYNIPAGSRLPLPFLGPGVTRIMGESECGGGKM